MYIHHCNVHNSYSIICVKFVFSGCQYLKKQLYSQLSIKNNKVIIGYDIKRIMGKVFGSAGRHNC